MLTERLKDLHFDPELERNILFVSDQIVNELKKDVFFHNPPKFTPLALLLFGSVLTDRFDKRVSTRSDLDFIVVVAEEFLADEVYRFGRHLSPGGSSGLVRLKRSQGFQDGNLSSDRDIDLLVISRSWLSWAADKIARLSDTEIVKCIQEDAWLTALASGKSLFNQIDDQWITSLFDRLQSLYPKTQAKID